MLCYLNGQFLPRAEASIPVEDRGFIFGDGVYEVWRVVNGRLFESERHLERLRYGLRELRIPAPAIAEGAEIERIATHILRENGLMEGEATLYVEVTRGVAPRTHAFPTKPVEPTVFVMANRFNPPEDVRARGGSAITMTDVRWLRCDIKTIQLLPNILGKQAATERGAVDVFFIRDGMVTEGSHANVLGVFDGVIRTHPLNNLILPGITRAVALDIARSLGIPVAEAAFSADDIALADELFLAGTTADIMPIVRVDDRAVGDGKPGAITVRLYKEFRAYMNASCGIGPARVAHA